MTRRSTRSMAAEPVQLSSPPATPDSAFARQKRKHVSSPAIKQEAEANQPSSTGKRKRTAIKIEAEAADLDLPHNLGDNGIPSPHGEEDDHVARVSRKGARPKVKTESRTPPNEPTADLEDIAKKSGLISPPKDSGGPNKKSARTKKINYGLSPGSSPYPGYNRPSPAECHEVVRLLSKVHGHVSAPKTIKAPSLTTAGCGEVPSVLDALIRTRLSAATTGTNSSRAFQGLVKTFGTIKSGVGKGSVDWGAVRRATQQQVFEAIKVGGLANNKSKDIKEILDMVWAENQERALALEKQSGDGGGSSSSSSSSRDNDHKNNNAPAGADHEAAHEKQLELLRVKEGVPSLDHLHLLSNEEAFNKLVTYPGIGPKTASCVLLFCLQRPSFAVDTHVFRLCRYLGWVPSDAEVKEQQSGNGGGAGAKWPRVERNSTYAHCEVMVPDELKYALHQLLIRHGKSCGRCRAATGMGSEGWKKGCPIEHLVRRHGAKKGEWDDGGSDGDGGDDVDGAGGGRAAAIKDTATATTTPPTSTSRGGTARGGKRIKYDSESEEAEMSDLGSEEEEESEAEEQASDEDDE